MGVHVKTKWDHRALGPNDVILDVELWVMNFSFNMSQSS